MKAFLTILAASLLLFGCNSNEPSAPQSDGLNFDILGDDAPDSFVAAMNELAELGISVSDPVTDQQMGEIESLNVTNDMTVVEASPLDEGDRPNFRRIIRHLHEQFRLLQRCLENTENRELRRVAYGARMAMRHGLRALEAGNPRPALQSFHQANRLLNMARRLCSEDNGGGGG